jgi:hypothetical protein
MSFFAMFSSTAIEFHNFMGVPKISCGMMLQFYSIRVKLRQHYFTGAFAVIFHWGVSACPVESRRAFNRGERQMDGPVE